MSSTQTIDSHIPVSGKLALMLECPPCGAVRTYVVDATLQRIFQRSWQAVRVAATCHCGHQASAVLGWHDQDVDFSSRPIRVAPMRAPWSNILDDAGICHGCNR